MQTDRPIRPSADIDHLTNRTGMTAYEAAQRWQSATCFARWGLVLLPVMMPLAREVSEMVAELER